LYAANPYANEGTLFVFSEGSLNVVKKKVKKIRPKNITSG
jgi:predicted peroxiredoxin